jgi:ABC-type Mn2+/Zn2+ transport system ATPase subunit
MSHLFDSFRIGHFRGFTDVELTDCGAVNLLIGSNNSGKTSILEALALYCRPLDQRDWLDLLGRRESAVGWFSNFEDILWLFPQRVSSETGLDYLEIELRATGRQQYSSVLVTAQKVSRIVPVEVQTSEDQYEIAGQEEEAGICLEVTLSQADSTQSRPAEQLEFWPNAMYLPSTSKASNLVPVVTLTPFSHRPHPLQLKGLSTATQQGWKDDVLSLLRRIDPSILSLEILSLDGRSPALFVDYKGVGLAPLSTLGDGLRRIISIALAIGNLKNGLLLIDEIESAVHVSALETVFPWLTAACKKNNVQLFATTHSLEALDALLGPEKGNDMVLYRLNRPDSPERVQRLAPDLVRRLRFDRGLDVRLGR